MIDFARFPLRFSPPEGRERWAPSMNHAIMLLKGGRGVPTTIEFGQEMGLHILSEFDFQIIYIRQK